MEKRNIEKLDINEIVRENLILGVPRENIKQTLLAQGYADFEIDRAIKKALMDKYVVEVHEKSAKKRSVFRSLTRYMFFIFLFLLLMAVILLFVMYGGNLFVSDGSSNLSSDAIDCGVVNGATNECFYNAAKNCSEAKIVSNNIIELSEYGFIEKSVSNQEIRGMENGKCLFYYQQLEAGGVFTGQERNNRIQQGNSLQQINDMEKTLNQSLATLDGKSMVCKLQPIDLIFMLERWMSSIFSLSDLDGPECEGELAKV